MNTERIYTMCSMSLYRIEIRRKLDCDASLERFEFFYSCSPKFNSPEKIILHCIGTDLSNIIREIESIVSPIAYISNVWLVDDCINDVVIFDKIRRNEC